MVVDSGISSVRDSVIEWVILGPIAQVSEIREKIVSGLKPLIQFPSAYLKH